MFGKILINFTPKMYGESSDIKHYANQSCEYKKR